MDKFFCFILGMVTGIVVAAGFQKVQEEKGKGRSFDSLEDSIEQRLETLERESRLEAVLN